MMMTDFLEVLAIFISLLHIRQGALRMEPKLE